MSKNHTRSTVDELHRRLSHLDRALARTRILVGLLCTLMLCLLTLGWRSPQDGQGEGSFHFVHEDVLYTRGVVVLDEARKARVVIGDLGARAHGESTGIAILDAEGGERFGVGLDGNETVNMGFDAPRGVGAPMPDRVALGVDAQGHGYLKLINNDTSVVARLATLDDERARLEFLDWERHRKVDWDSPEDRARLGELFTLHGIQRFGIESGYELGNPYR